MVRRSREVHRRFTRLRMSIDDSHVAGPRTVCDLLENKVLGAEDFEEGRVFCWCADQDQVVVFFVVEREKAASLDPKILVQRVKYLVKRMHSQDLADSSVVIQDECVRVAGRIEITHPSIWPANESRVTENDPRLLGAREETLPEDTVGQGRGWLDSGWSVIRVGQQERVVCMR